MGDKRHTPWWVKKGVPNPNSIVEIRIKIGIGVSQHHQDEKNPAWKGDNIGYKFLHQ